MHEGKRPGGLTALAVLNFVFGGYNLLQLLGTAVLLFFVVAMQPTPRERAAEETATAAENPEAAEQPEFEPEPEPRSRDEQQRQELAKLYGMPTLIAMLVLFLLIATLEIISGVGYLKQHRIWGRMVGNIYAFASMGTTIFGVVVSPVEAGGFTLIALAALAYPILTLILLNTTFRDDFTPPVNPEHAFA